MEDPNFLGPVSEGCAGSYSSIDLAAEPIGVSRRLSDVGLPCPALLPAITDTGRPAPLVRLSAALFPRT